MVTNIALKTLVQKFLGGGPPGRATRKFSNQLQQLALACVALAIPGLASASAIMTSPSVLTVQPGQTIQLKGTYVKKGAACLKLMGNIFSDPAGLTQFSFTDMFKGPVNRPDSYEYAPSIVPEIDNECAKTVDWTIEFVVPIDAYVGTKTSSINIKEYTTLAVVSDTLITPALTLVIPENYDVPPVGKPLNITANHNAPTTIQLGFLPVNANGQTYRIAGQPKNGAVSINGSVATYTPNSGFTGGDEFTYTVSNQYGASAPAKAMIAVLPASVDNNYHYLRYLGGPPGQTSYNVELDTMADFQATLTSPWGSTCTVSGITFIQPTLDVGYSYSYNNGPFVDGGSPTTGCSYMRQSYFSIAISSVDTLDFITWQTKPGMRAGDVIKIRAYKYAYTSPGWDNRPTAVPRHRSYGSEIITLNVVPKRPKNSLPELANASVMALEDTMASVAMVVTDADAGDTHAFRLAEPLSASIGRAIFVGKNLRFTPAANWNGRVDLKVVAEDSKGGVSNEAVVSVTITPVNDAPSASNATLAINEDTIGTLALDVTDVDLAYEGDSHTWSIVTAPNAAHGTATITGDTLTFTPALNWFGTATLTYQVRDAAGVYSNTATVTITVNPVNDAPVANNRTLTTAEDTAGTVTLVASDVEGSPLAYSVVAQPNAAHGIVTITGDKATFTPKPNWNGTTSFTYRAFDGEDYSSPATVSVTVTPVNDAPAASNRALAINEDTTGTLLLSVTDVDLTFEGDSHTWSVVTLPNATHGTATITGNTLTFKPVLDWFGTATLTYRVRDAAGVYSNTATVTITVNPVNDAPVVTNQVMSTNEDTAGTITLGVSDVDPGDTHTFHVVAPVNTLHGVVAIAGNKATFTPALNWYGTTTFSFVARDQAGAQSNMATVSVTVLSVNDVPVVSSPGLNIQTKEAVRVEIKYEVAR